MAKSETGAQLFARLRSRPSVRGLQPELFQSGPDPRDVIEFWGQEGTGKTEMLLHLVSSVILPESWRNVKLNGIDAGIIFFDNDYKFSILRLVMHIERKIHLACSVSSENPNDISPKPEDIENFIKDCLSKFQLIRCTNSSQMIMTLHNLEETLSSHPNVAIVIIDSISSFYWLDRCAGGENTNAQEANMNLVVEILTKLINNFNLIIIATKSELFQKRVKVKEDLENLDVACHSPADIKKWKPDSNITQNSAEYMCKSWQKLVKYRFIFEKDKSHTKDSSSKFNILCNFNNQSNKVSFVIDDNKLCFNTTMKSTYSNEFSVVK